MTTINIFILWLLPIIMGGYKEKILLDFRNQDEVPEWLIINDGVMGGISTSDIEFLPAGHIRFAGNVSLENNGGFASFRSRSSEYDLDGYEGIKIRIKGDGKVYSFRLRTNNSYDGIAFAADFKTFKDEWQEITIPFNEFLPRFRGRILSDDHVLDVRNIQQLGFLISEGQEGPFTLDIDWIKAWSD